MRCARPRITSATCRTPPLRRTCAGLPSTFSTARPQNLTPRASGTVTRRRCWRTSRPSRSALFKSASRSRVPAAELEALVLAALRKHLTTSGAGQQLRGNDRDLVERHLERVTLTANHVALRFRQIVEQAQELDAHDGANNSSGGPISSVKMIAVPWSSPMPAAVKGIIRVPAHNTPIKVGRRE